MRKSVVSGLLGALFLLAAGSLDRGAGAGRHGADRVPAHQQPGSPFCHLDRGHHAPGAGLPAPDIHRPDEQAGGGPRHAVAVGGREGVGLHAQKRRRFQQRRPRHRGGRRVHLQPPARPQGGQPRGEPLQGHPGGEGAGRLPGAVHPGGRQSRVCRRRGRLPRQHHPARHQGSRRRAGGQRPVHDRLLLRGGPAGAEEEPVLQPEGRRGHRAALPRRDRHDLLPRPRRPGGGAARRPARVTSAA